MANTWFRMYGMEYLNDPKIKSLTASERSCWLTILCYASISVVEGEVMYLTEKQIMLDAGVDQLSESWKSTIGFLQRFAQLGMIELGDAGLIRVKNWNKRQFVKTLSGYARIKRFRERKKSSDQNEQVTQQRFDEFWLIYPRKTAKQTAQRSWDRIAPDAELHTKIMEALSKHCKSDQWLKDEGRFIPHPATWLNQERWNDELKIKSSPLKGKYDNLK